MSVGGACFEGVFWCGGWGGGGGASVCQREGCVLHAINVATYPPSAATTYSHVCLFVWCSTFRARIFRSYGNVTIVVEGLQNSSL